MTYVERLRVPSWWWLVAVVMVASIALAVVAYVPGGTGWVVVALFAVAVGVVLYAYDHTVIRVEDGVLHVGRNRIEGRWIVGAEPLDRGESAKALSSVTSHRDFLATRPYIGDLVRIRLNDAADPHPHWLVSSRRAHELALAVDAIRKTS